mmetsp:Transcript_16310/g.47725  ORF Transcript_16310/g.47725 Transcript_16310/m.47725 type:complete len:757 (-) Transcript_16310:187-2457(-)
MGHTASKGEFSMLPASDGNRAICARFKEEGLDAVEFSDSDVSEGELEDAIGELQVVNKLASLPPQVRDCRPLPFHVIFVVDASASMGRHDVNGKQRLAAVFDACQSLVAQQHGEDSANEEDWYTLISFDTSAQVWIMRQGAEEARESMQDVRGNLLPAVHSTRFQAAFRKIADVLGISKTCKEDVRVVFLSDGAPHEGKHLGSITCAACATSDAEGGQACSLCGRNGPSYDSDCETTTDSLIRTLESELLGSPAVCGIKQLVIYTVAFGTDAVHFERFLKPLSVRTGGTHHVSNLSELGLCRAFGTIASSITTTRTSVTSTVPHAPGGGCRQRFDCASAGEKCCRVCDIAQLAGKNKAGHVDKLRYKCRDADVVVNSEPFASGGMRLVYNMEDSYNIEKHTPSRMVAKRLIRKEHATKKDMLPFCRSTETAIKFRTSFIRKLAHDANIFFVPCYLYSYSSTRETNYFVAEQFLEGDFVKFNSNNGYVNNEHPQSELLQAFSHYTFVQSRGKLLVLDLQGVVDNGWLILTDPQVVSRARAEERIYGPGDLGFEGMKAFFETHECGPTCIAMKLFEKQQKFQADMELKRAQCIICLDASRATRFKPCDHSLACAQCALELLAKAEKCPLCRIPIESYDPGIFSKTFAPLPKREKHRQAKPASPPAEVPRAQQPQASRPAPDVQSLLLPATRPPATRSAMPPRGGAARQPRPRLNLSSRPQKSGGYSNFKTIICDYWEHGECNRGQACTFAHGFNELRK